MKNKILTITFSIFIASIFIINLVTPDQELSYTERRYLKKLPDINITNLIDGTITNNFESYALDHFIFRDNLRSLKSYINLFVLKKQDNNELYYKDNHIFKIEYPLKENKVYSINVESVVINNNEWNYGGYLDIGLHDTMKDLIVNAIGAIFFSIFGYFGMTSKKEENYEKLIVIKKRKKEQVNF